MRSLAIAVALLAVTVASADGETAATIDSLEERIQELRAQASYAQAIDVGAELLAARLADPDAKPYEIADAERLLEVLRNITDLSDEATRELALADSLTQVAEACWMEGRNTAGAAAVERQLEIRRRLLGRVHPDVSTSLNNLGFFLLQGGDNAGAEPLFREALALDRELLGDEHPDVATDLNNLASLLVRQGDYAGAEALFHEALEIWRKLLGDEHLDVAMGLGNLADLLRARGDYAGSARLSREALAIEQKLLGNEHPDVSVSLNNLAMALQGLGDYAGAEPLFREALAMGRKTLGDEHPGVAGGLNNLASLLRDQGDYAEAEPLYREALALYRGLLGEEHLGVATAMNNLASLLCARGDYAAAEPLYRDALAMRKKLLGEEHVVVAQSLSNLGSLIKARGDYADAEPLFREAGGMMRRLLGAEHPHVAQSLHNLAHLLYASGDYAGAEPLYRDALAMWRRLLGETHPYVATGLTNLAVLLCAKGDYAAAELASAEAARAHEAARLRAGAGVKRASFQSSPYPVLASARLALGRMEEAWPAAEKALGRSLADLLTVAGGRDLSWSEAAREDSLSGAIGELERALGVYQNAARSDTTGETAALARETRTALLAAEAEWGVLQREIALAYPVTEGETFPLERVQSVLSEQAAIVSWLDIEVRKDVHESWCYAIRSSGPVVWARAGSPSSGADSRSPFERARSFRDRLARPASSSIGVARDSHELWAERVEPLLDALAGVEELIVVPSGAMLGVPAEVLIDDEGVFVGERYAVSYAPSATLHTWLAEQPVGDVPSGVLLLGDPPYGPAHLAAMEREEDVLVASADAVADLDLLRSALAGNADALAALPRLRGTRDEVGAIAGLSEAPHMLLGPDATEQELVRLAESGRLAEFGTIHMATHGLIDDERPERSALVLSQVELPDALATAMAGGRVCDGLLTAGEIIREWDLNADLVTLSACETALGKKVAGEGYVGFAHAFLQAGARSLLVSLWKVEDEATSLLMRRFYENRLGKYDDERRGFVGEPMSKAAALQEAKGWLQDCTDRDGRKPYDDPYYWSAFILIGDPG